MKKFAYFCILSLFLALACTGCAKKDDTPNPYEDPANYKSGLHYVQMYVYGYGNIFMVLDADAAPATVTNFLALVNNGFYNGLTFHRVIDGYMIQGGDPKANGTGKSTFTIPGEFAANGHENPISHVRGTISMARSEDYDSASCQFFIVQEDSTKLDGQYAAFGTVVHGMDVVDLICDLTPVKNNNGTVDYAYQPVILYTAILDKETFEYLEKYDFNPPEEVEEETTESPFNFVDVTMELVAKDHGKNVAETWTITDNAETYLLSSEVDLANAAIFNFSDFEEFTYDAENPLAQLEDLVSGEFIEILLNVPETIPSYLAFSQLVQKVIIIQKDPSKLKKKKKE